MDKLYYVSEKELADDGQIEYTTGITDISIYRIENNIPKLLGEITNKMIDGDYLFTNEETILNFIDEFVSEINSDKIQLIRL